MGQGRKPAVSDKVKVRNNLLFSKEINDVVVRLALERKVSKTQIVEEAIMEYLQKRGIQMKKTV